LEEKVVEQQNVCRLCEQQEALFAQNSQIHDAKANTNICLLATYTHIC